MSTTIGYSKSPLAPSVTQSSTTTYLPLIAGHSTILVTGSLQDAINTAQPGDVLQLEARTYPEDVVIEQAGRASAPIILQGTGQGRSVIQGEVLLRNSAAFWRIQDLDVDASGSDDAIKLDAPTRSVTIQRVHLYGGSGYGVRVGTDVSDVEIADCEINGFDGGGRDAHGVGIMTAQNVTVRGCDIHTNSGDAIQTNTPDFPGYARFAANILIENNRLFDNRENALDIKSTHGLTARNNQIWGAGVVSGSDGMAIQVQHDAQDIVIESNEVWDAVEGIEVTRGSKGGVPYPAVPQRVRISGNLFRDIKADPQGSNVNGTGIVIRLSNDVQVYNNTVLNADRFGLYVASTDGMFPTAVDIRNNVFAGAMGDLEFSRGPQPITGLIIDYNHYINGIVDGKSVSAWRGEGYESNATSGEPKLDAAFLPQPGSQLRDSGIDVGLPFTGSAPDRGWGEL